MTREMVESNYLEELLKGIPDELFDGIYSEKDLLKIVDLPMESFANDGYSGEWGVNESTLPWPTPTGPYVGCQPVWNAPIEHKPKLIPLNSLFPIPDPILPDASVGLPLAAGDDGMRHINSSTVLDTLAEVKPTAIPLNGLITKPGPIPSDVSDAMLESRPTIMSLNGSISETQTIPSAASFGLSRVVDDKVIKHSTGCAVSDTLLESKPKLIPSNSMLPNFRPVTVDAMIGSPLVVERQVAKHTVENAHADILPQHNIDVPSDGKVKVLESGTSRVHSPVSVLDSSSCNSAQTSLSNINFRSARYGKRSKRPRPEHGKTPWFFISLIPPAASAKKTFTRKNREKKKKKTSPISLARSSNSMENMAGSFTKKKCLHCEVTKTPQWREGPNGPKTLCNACGVRYRSGRLYPEYRPAASPTFTPYLHSNSHRKVVEMRKQGMPEPSMMNYPRSELIDTTEQAMQGGNTVVDSPRSPDSPLIENIPMIGHPFELIY